MTKYQEETIMIRDPAYSSSHYLPITKTTIGKYDIYSGYPFHKWYKLAFIVHNNKVVRAAIISPNTVSFHQLYYKKRIDSQNIIDVTGEYPLNTVVDLFNKKRILLSSPTYISLDEKIPKQVLSYIIGEKTMMDHYYKII